MIAQLLVALACLMGAAGIVLTAAAAHAVKGAGLDLAGFMLLFHAPAVIAVMAAASNSLLWRPLETIGAMGLILGAVLFAGDIALRAYTGHRLFPMAAPTGGMVLIASWLALAAAALAAFSAKP
ncbi:MAG: DUF423 domain-containing protein [Rhizobiales bacterium]|nr:DUF423 domain-containing protein [Hyphomicrobiales bacterium]